MTFLCQEWRYKKKRGVAISRDAPFFFPIGLLCLTKPGMFRA
jgi:hypothetical protein